MGGQVITQVITPAPGRGIQAGIQATQEPGILTIRLARKSPQVIQVVTPAPGRGIRATQEPGILTIRLARKSPNRVALFQNQLMLTSQTQKEARLR